jgi:hypothetical protein
LDYRKALTRHGSAANLVRPNPTGATDAAQFGLAAHEAAALSGAVTRFNSPAS